MKKILINLLLVIVAAVVAYPLFKLSANWPGMDIKFGWVGQCFGSFTGFPFGTLSCPPAGIPCICSTNQITGVLDYLFWVLILVLIVFGIKKLVTK